MASFPCHCGRICRNASFVIMSGRELKTYIGLLRAINVGGRNRIAMADLRTLLGSLGYSNVQTVLQSGNVVFEGKATTGAALERRLEAETEKAFRVSVAYCVRTAPEWME